MQQLLETTRASHADELAVLQTEAAGLKQVPLSACFDNSYAAINHLCPMCFLEDPADCIAQTLWTSPFRMRTESGCQQSSTGGPAARAGSCRGSTAADACPGPRQDL